jgi:cellobiose phosphorylase
MVETLLGLTLEDHKLRFNPCLPESWTAFTLEYRFGETLYRVSVSRADSGEAASLIIDDNQQGELVIPLVDDHGSHTVEVRLGVL